MADFGDFFGGGSDPGSTGALDFFKTTTPDITSDKGLGFDWGSLFKQGSDLFGGLTGAAGLGQMLMGLMKGGGSGPQMPQMPMGGMTGSIGGTPDDVRKAMAGKQAQGVTEGGAVSPESISAIMGGGPGGQQIDPKLMQIIMQMTQQQGGQQ